MSDYEPYGEEWYKVVKKHTKDQIVTFYAEVCKEAIQLRKENKELKMLMLYKFHFVCLDCDECFGTSSWYEVKPNCPNCKSSNSEEVTKALEDE